MSLNIELIKNLHRLMDLQEVRRSFTGYKRGSKRFL